MHKQTFITHRFYVAHYPLVAMSTRNSSSISSTDKLYNNSSLSLYEALRTSLQSPSFLSIVFATATRIYNIFLSLSLSHIGNSRECNTQPSPLSSGNTGNAIPNPYRVTMLNPSITVSIIRTRGTTIH